MVSISLPGCISLVTIIFIHSLFPETSSLHFETVLPNYIVLTMLAPVAKLEVL